MWSRALTFLLDEGQGRFPPLTRVSSHGFRLIDARGFTGLNDADRLERPLPGKYQNKPKRTTP
jgi:hypothetical protein